MPLCSHPPKKLYLSKHNFCLELLSETIDKSNIASWLGNLAATFGGAAFAAATSDFMQSIAEAQLKEDDAAARSAEPPSKIFELL